ncbi:hypothetical protein PC123_g14171 [Phytophthora cactorum]|nr:hypothetical protein PC123_g14171 [Phytophthora cactorum]
MDEQAVALILPCVSLSVVSGGSCRTIKSQHYVVQNTEGPIVEMLPRDLSSRVIVSMVGSMTSTQIAMCKKKYDLNLRLCRLFQRFLNNGNHEYKRRSTSLNQQTPLNSQGIPTSVIVDRRASCGPAEDDDYLITSIRDESTHSAFGSTVDEGEDQAIKGTWIGASSFLLLPQQQNWADIVVRKSNVYDPMSKWAVCERMFHTPFPGGCGGPVEPRLKHMSVRKWILRCLQVHGHRFETHHAFMLLAYGCLASVNVRRTLYVKMNVKRQALKVAEYPRNIIREAMQYFHHITVYRSKGIEPRLPSLDVQHVIDIRKGLYVLESAFYCSNFGRMRARHDLYGMLKRFGPLQIFFTVPPDCRNLPYWN